jgi:acetyltransferase-like isoleucine patch superfamily enzyme
LRAPSKTRMVVGMKKLLLLAIMFLPLSLKRKAYRAWFGYQIADDARIGLAFLFSKQVVMERGTRIGHFTIIKQLDTLRMAEGANIGAFNMVTAIPSHSNVHFTHQPERVPALIMGAHSSLTGRHYVDCCDTVTIGAFTIVAGMATRFFSHSVNMELNRQETAPITIGAYCMVGAGSIILKGSTLPDYCALGAGSTLQKTYFETHMLYSGVPATPVKQLSPHAAYFQRTTGFIA